MELRSAPHCGKSHSSMARANTHAIGTINLLVRDIAVAGAAANQRSSVTPITSTIPISGW